MSDTTSPEARACLDSMLAAAVSSILGRQGAGPVPAAEAPQAAALTAEPAEPDPTSSHAQQERAPVPLEPLRPPPPGHGPDHGSDSVWVERPPQRAVLPTPENTLLPPVTATAVERVNRGGALRSPKISGGGVVRCILVERRNREPTPPPAVEPKIPAYFQQEPEENDEGDDCGLGNAEYDAPSAEAVSQSASNGRGGRTRWIRQSRPGSPSIRVGDMLEPAAAGNGATSAVKVTDIQSDVWVRWTDGSTARVGRDTIRVPPVNRRTGLASHTFASRAKCRTAWELRESSRLQMRADVGFMSATSCERVEAVAARNHRGRPWPPAFVPGMTSAATAIVSASAGVRLPSFRTPRTDIRPERLQCTREAAIFLADAKRMAA